MNIKSIGYFMKGVGVGMFALAAGMTAVENRHQRNRAKKKASKQVS